MQCTYQCGNVSLMKQKEMLVDWGNEAARQGKARQGKKRDGRQGPEVRGQETF